MSEASDSQPGYYSRRARPDCKRCAGLGLAEFAPRVLGLPDEARVWAPYGCIRDDDDNPGLRARWWACSHLSALPDSVAPLPAEQEVQPV